MIYNDENILRTAYFKPLDFIELFVLNSDFNSLIEILSINGFLDYFSM